MHFVPRALTILFFLFQSVRLCIQPGNVFPEACRPFCVDNPRAPQFRRHKPASMPDFRKSPPSDVSALIRRFDSLLDYVAGEAEG